MSVTQKLRDAADVFEERHEVYGDNYRKVGKIMRALFPSGVNLQSEDDQNRYHILVLTVVKLTRYSENWHRGGHEDSSIDAAVYWAMLNEIDAEIKARELVPF